jgi:hypothetical protein
MDEDFLKSRGISYLDEQMSASQEGLFSCYAQFLSNMKKTEDVRTLIFRESEVLTAELIKSEVCWDIMARRWLNSHRLFGGTAIIRNVGMCLRLGRMEHSRRSKSRITCTLSLIHHSACLRTVVRVKGHTGQASSYS